MGKEHPKSPFLWQGVFEVNKDNPEVAKLIETTNRPGKIGIDIDGPGQAGAELYAEKLRPHCDTGTISEGPGFGDFDCTIQGFLEVYVRATPETTFSVTATRSRGE